MSDEISSDNGSACDWDDGRLSISETQDLCNITYSREASIAAFTDYFEFLTAMFMDPELVHQPPEGGWPEITVDIMRELGKTDEVAELLRRLPYARSPSGEEGKEPDLKRYRQRTEGIYEHVPPHVVGLVSAVHFEMFLDTQLGVIYFPGCIYVPGPTAVAQDTDGSLKPVADDPHDYASTEEANDWRTGGMGLKCAWAIPEFLEMMKYHFRNLSYLPLARGWVAGAFGEDEENARGMPAAFPTKHGWSDLAQYQKDKCMDELDSRLEELFDH
ncbi:hypothetical protein TI39_contig4166g00009 [Zymoseptoria brevis]|uniref:Uncharacterized protein n=1 Tax=Zymoseptoria brevis TaxID=1047168 RepID=A0A0F4GCE6_9PEZI|nr:hypothetical protein TI39_contig4166g00009 [Zymoseptoria brevis]